ncbi:MAG: HEXXH motif-containing putative peptide modification protein [Celeribacter sp.]|jgi:HEXXH motif-containing protein
MPALSAVTSRSDAFRFVPSTVEGEAIDASVHEDLAGSLAYLAEHMAPAHPECAGALDAVAARIRDGQRLPPVAFGLYYQMGEAALTGDLDAAADIAQVLAQVPAAPPGLQVMRRGGAEAQALWPVLEERFGPEEAAGFAPVSAELAQEFETRLNDGLALMQKTLPDLHGEITAILREVLLAQAPVGAKMEFDGASHYQFWGLLLLNPNHHKTPLAVVEVLAHEAAHSLLFGLTRTEPLVLNPDDELFTSPLRIDPRPMDGIYHATFVSARMAWAMERMSESPALPVELRHEAARLAAEDRANFAKGIGTVDAHGRLSTTGARIMDQARAYIDGQ